MNSKSGSPGNRFARETLPHIVYIAVLLSIFLIYIYSIFHEKLPIGNTDHGYRFHIALEYARTPDNAVSIGSWLSVWPPIPFIIQGAILRLVLFPGMSDASTGIAAIQLTNVVLVLLGFYFIGRSVAIQTDELTGCLACVTCLSASIMLFLAPTTSSAVYAFFFVSLAFLKLLQFIAYEKGFLWSVCCFTLSFYCRSESLVLMLVAGAFLFVNNKIRAAVLMIAATFTLAFSKLLLAILLIDDVKFFEYGKLNDFGNTLRQAEKLINQLFRYNQSFFWISLACVLPLVFLVAKSPRSVSLFQSPQLTSHLTSRIKTPSDDRDSVQFKDWLAGLVRQVSLWIASFPILLWTGLLLITLAVLFAEILRGNINAQARYLFMANVFLTTVIAIFVAQSTRIIFTGRDRIAKSIAACSVLVLLSFSIWSGVAHASGQTLLWKIFPPEQDVIHFIRDRKHPGDRVVYDFLDLRERIISPYLIDPGLTTSSQFLEGDPDVIALLPEELQNQSQFSERALDVQTARIHAFIHHTQPRYMVLASEKFFEAIQQKGAPSIIGWSTSFIRNYLTQEPGQGADYRFQSPYVFPDRSIEFSKVHQNHRFVILERQPSPDSGDVVADPV